MKLNASATVARPVSNREFPHGSVSFFVVLFQGRSGSSWLIEALSSHPQIEAIGEKLAALHVGGAVPQSRWLASYFADRPPDGSVHGFKTKLTDVIDVPGFASRLVRSQCAVIWLERDNLVKQAVSWLRADELYERHGVHNIRDPDDRMPASQLDAAELLRRTITLDRGRSQLGRFIEGLNLPTLRIRYEDLLENPESVFDVTQRFLRVDHCSLTASLVKATSDSLAAAIANLEEVEEAFRGTGYLEMLYRSSDSR